MGASSEQELSSKLIDAPASLLAEPVARFFLIVIVV